MMSLFPSDLHVDCYAMLGRVKSHSHHHSVFWIYSFKGSFYLYKLPKTQQLQKHLGKDVKQGTN